MPVLTPPRWKAQSSSLSERIGLLSKDEVFEKLKEVLTTGFGLGREQLAPTARLVEDLDLDSLDSFDLMVRLEQETGEEIKEDELKSIQTIEDIVDVIHRKLESKESRQV